MFNLHNISLVGYTSSFNLILQMSDGKGCSISSKDNDLKKPKPCCACPETKKVNLYNLRCEHF